MCYGNFDGWTGYKNSKLTFFNKWFSCVMAILMNGLVIIYMETLKKCVSFSTRICLNEIFKRTSFAYKSLNLLLVQFLKATIRSWRQPILGNFCPLSPSPLLLIHSSLLGDVNLFNSTPPSKRQIELIYFNKIISKFW